MKKLYIVRGIPGSGKTTYCRKQLKLEPIEADTFFIRNGEYRYDPTKIADAHTWCQKQVRKQMIQGVQEIAVANTFVKHKEYRIYEMLAQQYGYEVEKIIMRGNYQNVHNVPQRKLDNMKQNFEE